VISTFKKDKSHGMDGWSTKFFDEFFDILRDDLLRVVEESKFLGKFLGNIYSTFIDVIPKTDFPLTFNDL